jgi:tricorn protease
MWEMQGELGTSHCYEMGGDYLPEPAYWHGFLGADLAWRAGAWRIERIPRGDSWNEDARSPLAAPGTGIRKGDRILAIDGRPVGAKQSPQERLVNRARCPVTLTVRRGNGRPRDVVVTTLGAEFGLRYRDWVEANRESVHKATRGRVGYVHVPDMGPRGYAEFHRYFKTEMDYEGLIIDVRYNGGGHVSQLLLEKLLRKRVGYDASRWQGKFPYPSEAPMGPMVALTNEYAGSDGDIFSHCFKLYGLGPLIGKRTWGGVVGIWPRHTLVDGTVTTQPEFSFWFEDVGYGVENYGTDPDIEVDIKPQDYARGKDPQLDTGIKEIRKILKTAKVLKPDLSKRPSLKAPKLPKRK